MIFKVLCDVHIAFKVAKFRDPWLWRRVYGSDKVVSEERGEKYNTTQPNPLSGANEIYKTCLELVAFTEKQVLYTRLNNSIYGYIYNIPYKPSREPKAHGF